jgi:hypothetical protein
MLGAAEESSSLYEADQQGTRPFHSSLSLVRPLLSRMVATAKACLWQAARSSSALQHPKAAWVTESRSSLELLVRLFSARPGCVCELHQMTTSDHSPVSYLDFCHGTYDVTGMCKSFYNQQACTFTGRNLIYLESFLNIPNRPDARFLRDAGAVEEDELESTDLETDKVELEGLSLTPEGKASFAKSTFSTAAGGRTSTSGHLWAGGRSLG